MAGDRIARSTSHGASADPAVTVRFDAQADELVLLDQTLLPGEVRYLRLTQPEEVREAIYNLRVRGAPAIGVAAAYGAYLGAFRSRATDVPGIARDFQAASDLLKAARPTAVNLAWALERMARALRANAHLSPRGLLAALKSEADLIRTEDEEVCRRIGENGLALLQPGWGLLTHCNAGALATSRYGTATAPIYLGAQKGYAFRVFADETRPLLQGARLTAWELHAAGIDVTVICDNMASTVMSRGWVQAVLVGCDRVAANGDTANKIGTSGVAILAKHYGIPFYVHAPLSSIDLGCASGRDIPIEERAPEEIAEMWYARRMTPQGVKAYNPAFDVTDNSLITAIVTEKGVIRPPYTTSIRALFP
ncbi:MAG: S-methyl-5-thioribose-1-phosphate isomerase [Spirochaetia bacterium]